MSNKKIYNTVLLALLVALSITYANARTGTNPVSNAIHSNAEALMMKNPAAIYCADIMGYKYEVVEGQGSAQTGLCSLPDGQQCDQWEFYAGMCGPDYSYCAQHGYRTEARSDGQDPFSPTYAVCISQNDQVVGSVSQLINLGGYTGCSGSEGCLPAELSQTLQPADLAPDGHTTIAEPSVPSSFDWRNYQGYNWLTGVKNQGGCGSCWAFAAAGVVEVHHNIYFSNPSLDLDLSEQDLVSCSGAGSCSGGSSVASMEYIKETGIVDEGCFPYAASDLPCNKCADWQDRLTFVDEETSFVPDQPSIRQSVVDYGPIYVYMGIGSEFGGYFDGNGIYRCTDDSSINHAVVIVGYDNSGGYWIVRNSWGSSWNGDGYFKVGYGECAIDSYYAGYAYVVPPITSHYLSGTLDGDWYVTDVVVTLSANELVQWTRYRIDGGGWNTYYTPFSMHSDGIHTLEYYSKDRFGSEETVKSTAIRIDQSAPDNPTTTDPGCAAQNGLWQNTCTDPAFNWSGADDHGGSGVKDYHVYWGTDPSGSPSIYVTQASFDPGPITAPGGLAVYYLRIATRDHVNHESVPETLFTLRYDAAPPNGSFTIDNGQTKTYDIYVDLQVTGQDAGSGLGTVKLSNDQTTWIEMDYSPEIPWTILPLHKTRVPVYLQLVDNLGNTSATYVRRICLNLYPPPPSSDNYRLWSAGPTAAGQIATSSGFYLADTLGEPIAGGHLSSASYQLKSGFQALWPAMLGDDLYTDWGCQTCIHLPLVFKNR